MLAVEFRYCRFGNVGKNLIFANTCIRECVALRIHSKFLLILNINIFIALLFNQILACEFKNSQIIRK